MTLPHILIANVHFAPFSYGGATVVAEEVAYALMYEGKARVSAVSTCIRDDLAPYSILRCEARGIPNYLINLPRHRSATAQYDNPDVTLRLVELMETLAPDVVHAHCLQDLGVGVLEAARRAGIPTILSVHDFWWICERQFMVRVDHSYCGQNPVHLPDCRGCVDKYSAAQFRHRRLTEASQDVAAVTYPSRFARDLCERSGFAPGRGVVWENGVHLPKPEFWDRQQTRRAADARITFGYLGGPAAIKGWPLIRSAFQDVDSNDFRVLLVDGSRDGHWWKGATFDTLAGEWEVVPRFDQDNMDAFFAQIDVLIFPSQWKETFGLAIREAASRGIQIIQTDSGGTTEHAAVVPDSLIPIGSGPRPLLSQINKALQAGQAEQTPVAVESFGDQAQAFETILSTVLQGDTCA